ncbi:MAG: UvrD-helicase domain-containing protein [Sulfuricaulis sp.]|uniref:UvrD-helicase domain-containing protein n=1 Tax=Sulfuricaulis sp. TaxID=2003553 RepID=UPI0025CD9276|nr:UvrD-helicase domain-containing protein [Sulfuricaulis sp.]MCR4347439.1 UvrD-helicase domain-containing protein [Sulfuricaulis sp.]
MPKLNPPQKAAVQYVNGPLLVLAGAGSGKTSVITRKISWLIRDYGIAPRHIVAITFTNRAAREMKSRVSDLMNGEYSKELLISTFHTFGLKILREHLSDIGYRPGFSLYDGEDSQALLSKLLRGQYTGKINPAEAVRHQISLWKNNLVSPAEAPLTAGGETIQDVAARIYGEYERHLQAYNAMDLDDLILKPVRLLQEHPELLAEWRQRVRYLLVDEFQDTNLCQYQLVKLLAGDRGALTVVGDDDQSIYAWRGAHPENLKQLQQDFPLLKVIKLEQNYRSSGRILKAANALIANNSHLFEKSLWCDRDYGESLRVLRARGEEHEAERVISELLNHKFKNNTDFRDYAILFRENNQSRVLERVLRERRIPHFQSGGTSFFDKTEIKDVMAYLRLLCNPGDDNAFLRVINTPRREIVPATLELLSAHAAELNTSLLQASMDPGIDTKLTARQETTLRGFTHWLMEMITKSEDDEPGKLVCDMLTDLHYEDWLKDICNDQKIAQRRMENVLELVGWIQRLARQEEDLTLSDLVARLTLSGILDKGDQENPGDLVSLMTVHAAKGLEFPHVFIVGMEEGLMPQHQNKSEAGVEEERRLAYVAMTRARQTLTFSFVDRRKRGGEVIICESSRFLRELPSDDLKWEEPDREPDAQAMLGRADIHVANLRNMLGNS